MPIQPLLTRSISSSDAPAMSLPKAPILIATHQTEFNMDALPTRPRGRPRRTRDMDNGGYISYMLVFVEELSIRKQGFWAQTVLFVARLRAVKLHGCAVNVNIHAINTYLLLGSSFIWNA